MERLVGVSKNIVRMVEAKNYPPHVDVALAHVAGLKHSEIAKMFNISERRSRQYYRQFLMNFADVLGVDLSHLQSKLGEARLKLIKNSEDAKQLVSEKEWETTSEGLWFKNLNEWLDNPKAELPTLTTSVNADLDTPGKRLMDKLLLPTQDLDGYFDLNVKTLPCGVSLNVSIEDLESSTGTRIVHRYLISDSERKRLAGEGGFSLGDRKIRDMTPASELEKILILHIPGDLNHAYAPRRAYLHNDMKSRHLELNLISIGLNKVALPANYDEEYAYLEIASFRQQNNNFDLRIRDSKSKEALQIHHSFIDGKKRVNIDLGEDYMDITTTATRQRITKSLKDYFRGDRLTVPKLYLIEGVPCIDKGYNYLIFPFAGIHIYLHPDKNIKVLMPNIVRGDNGEELLGFWDLDNLSSGAIRFYRFVEDKFQRVD